MDPDLRARGVIAFSSGNHAQGIAKAAAEFASPAVIVMPSDAPAMKIANTRDYGAEVVLYDRATEDRDRIGAALAVERGLTLVKPFDEPQVIAGQGTVGLEIAQQAAAAGVQEAQVLVCCGGGGLSSGIALALAADAPGFKVHPVEPEGFDDVKRSLESGQIESNAHTTGSICDAIITPSPGQITFPILAAHCGPGLTVSDDDCLRAMAAAFTRLKLVIEPGGVVALAAALYHPEALSGDSVIVVATGGNVDAGLYAEALARFG
jgi:threonine dehydratase